MSRVRGIRLLLSGGLGNQLFQYAACRALSLDCDCPLEIDLRFFKTTSDYSIDHCRAFQLGDLPIQATVVPGGPGTHRLLPSLYRRFLTERPSIRYTSKRVAYDPGFLRRHPPLVVSAYLPSPRYFEHHAKLIRNELSPDVWLDEAARPHLRHMRDVTSVAVHVRRTDYMQHPNLSLRDPENYYRRALEQLQRKVGELGLFVFSDDIPWCRASDLFDHFLTTYITFPDGAVSPGRELALMSKCTHHVIANSSYSWWGAWLAQADRQQVFVPSTWTKGVHSRDDGIVPATWNVVHV